MEQQSYIRVRNSQINFYKEVALYYQSGADAYCLYKPPGTNLAEMRISRKRHPGLYIQDDVEAGKFSRDIFEKFCYSLI